MDGIAKAQVATKLAAVYLMDHKADKAVATIRDSQITGLPAEEMHERMLLQARAFALDVALARALGGGFRS